MDERECLPGHPESKLELSKLENVLELLLLFVGQDLVAAPVNIEELNPSTPETFFASDLHDFLKCYSYETPEKELREK